MNLINIPRRIILCILMLAFPLGTLLWSEPFFQFHANNLAVEGHVDPESSEGNVLKFTLNFDVQVFGSYGQSAKIPRSATLTVRETKEGDLHVSQLESSRSGGVSGIGASSLIYVEGLNGIEEVILIVAKGNKEIPEPYGGVVLVEDVREFLNDVLQADLMVFRFPQSIFMPQ